MKSDSEELEHVILAFGDDDTEKESTRSGIVQRLKKKIAGMTRIRKGLTVDSGAADHVMPIGWLILLTVLQSVGSKCGLHCVAAD